MDIYMKNYRTFESIALTFPFKESHGSDFIYIIYLKNYFLYTHLTFFSNFQSITALHT